MGPRGAARGGVNFAALPRKRGRGSPLSIDDIDVTAFIKRADDLMYRAKREGRNRVVG